MKQDFNFLGFKVNKRNFILSCIIALSVILFLLGVHILWFDIPWYGLLIGTAFILAVVIAGKLGEEKGIYKDMPYDLVWLVFPLAIIGARVAYVVNSPGEFESITDMLAIWTGGLSIYGGILGGLIGVIIFSMIKKIKTLVLTDIAAPVLILGQAIGRWGNFANQEVYGKEITNSMFKWFPFGVNISNGLHEGWFLATFFYESVLNFVGFLILLKILRKSTTKGVTTFSYLIYYGFVRMLLEPLRMPEFILHTPVLGIRFSFAVSIMIILIGIAGLVYLLKIKPLKVDVSNEQKDVVKKSKQALKESELVKESKQEKLDKENTDKSQPFTNDEPSSVLDQNNEKEVDFNNEEN